MLSIARKVFSLPAAMFYCMAASLWCEALDRQNRATLLIALLGRVFLASSIALWVLDDARRRRRAIPYDFTSFVFFAWPVFAPVYLVVTRGWRAFVPLGCFLGFYVAAVLVGSIPYILRVLPSSSP